MLRQLYYFAVSEAVILDSYCILASIFTTDKSPYYPDVAFCRHHEKFGYSILDKPEGSSSRMARLMKMHENYDFILAAGDGYKAHLAEGFNYPESKIVTLPLPRVELLKSEEYGESVRKRIFSAYPQLKDKKISSTFQPSGKQTTKLYVYLFVLLCGLQ